MKLTDERVIALRDGGYQHGTIHALAKEVLESRAALENAHIGVAVSVHKAEIEALEKELLSVYRELDGARAVTEILSRYDELKTILANPIAVHLNMLRGEIAKPSLENIEHLYPEIGARIAELTRERDEARQWNHDIQMARNIQENTITRQFEARIAKLEAVLQAKLMPALLSPEQYMVADAASEARSNFALELLIAVTAVLQDKP